VRKYLLAVAAAAIAAPQVAWAERPSDHAWLDLGAFAAHIDSDLRLDNETLGIEGTRVDFEKDLGLDSSKVMPKASIGVRIGKAFRVEGDFVQLRRTGDLTLDENLVIDDTVFPIHAEVHTDFKTDIYRVAAGYSFVRQDDKEFGIAVGAHVTTGTFHIRGEGPLGIGLEEHRSKSAPLPNVGLYGSIKLFGPVSLQGNVDAFQMKYGHYKGKLLDGQLAADYRFAKNFGAGLGYRYAWYRITGDTHNWHGVLSYSYSGPVAYLELAF
jgi:hypothetical protein